ncbi:hypothetical protein VKT23_005511 [Stygiomarasmius scandens]|uniref:Plant basic secretory protein n=1 Tax=Marasmiellus scandens TaxID=2682957 RepID=A0ABR1JQH5_9AGAR
MPNLHLRVQDLDHPGADLFFRLVGNGKATLKEGILQCTRGLYSPNYSLSPKITQITLTLRSFSGVAYTFGAPSNPFEHKEIHFSLDHIVNTHSKFDGDKDKRTREEIQGVLTHELVHCYQWNAKGTCPGGLIEGIADFIRLRASLSPPHWKHSNSGKWDAGYEKTAFFLDWIDHRQPPAPRYSTKPKSTPSSLPSLPAPSPSPLPGGCSRPAETLLRPGLYNPQDKVPKDTIVQRLNAWMREREYVEGKIWIEVTGKTVDELWKEYCSCH